MMERTTRSVVCWPTVSLLISAALIFGWCGLAVAQDCNSNGIPDDQDIADGTSLDCQPDGVPDECQLDAAPGINIDEALANLNANNTAISDLVPTRYNFTGGETGYSISDGGNDMYDGGNRLNTNLANDINYTNSTITPSDAQFGAASQYFTAKYTGLFVMVAMDISIDLFEIRGNNGADGSGSSDGTTLVTTSKGRTYTIYVKRVYNARDPSINHITIVPGNGDGITHTWASNTNDDLDTISGLAGVTELYYLLVARASGAYLADADVLNIANEFLWNVAAGPGDCNGNGVPDDCDIRDGISQDLNTNTLPDECEDCNGNGIPDDMDIADGTSADLNANGLPDECEDCNGNGMLDECDASCGPAGGYCDVAGCGTSADCNVNGNPDECDIASGTSMDCNGNNVPDECDVTAIYQESRIPDVWPCDNRTATCIFATVPEAHSEVAITFDVTGDYDSSSEYFNASLNGYNLGPVFNSSGTCSRSQTINVSAETWNSYAAGSDAVITMQPTSSVGCTVCDPYSVNVSIVYAVGSNSADCNSNGIPDECEEDCNDNGIPDDCDIASSYAELRTPDVWPCDGRTATCVFEAAPLAYEDVAITFDVAGDYDTSSEYLSVTINSCDVGLVFDDSGSCSRTEQMLVPASTWNTCVTDGQAVIAMRPSANVDCNVCSPYAFSVSVEYGTQGNSTDCDGNGIPDECDPDCNRNGVADGCEIADGSAADSNGNGIPDECDSCFGTNRVTVGTHPSRVGNMSVKGTFAPFLPFDPTLDDVTCTIEDEYGQMITLAIPAGSFEPMAQPNQMRYRYDSPHSQKPSLRAVIDLANCDFLIDAKKVSEKITGPTMTISLIAGANISQETVQADVKPQRLDYATHGTLDCCP